MQHRNAPVATIFGGSGFVGTQLVQMLARQGYRIRVAVRRPDLAGHLRPLGAVGQIQAIQANLRDRASVERAVVGAEVVINLVGILFERGRQRFATIQAEGAGLVAAAAAGAGARVLVHMSALGADPEAASTYARSKAEGEALVLKAFPKAVIMRPSLIFGADDGFFNRFAGLARTFPILPVVGADTRFQPVYVGDVAAAFAAAAEGRAKGGKIYELGGPEIETMRVLMQRMLHETGRTNPLLCLPAGPARLIAHVLQLLPAPMLTVDQVLQLQHDNVVSEGARKQKLTLLGLGITPTAMETILPSYLWRFRRQGQFARAEA